METGMAGDSGPIIGETIVVDETGVGAFQAEVRAGAATILVDEPVSAGGLGSGPNPFDLLSAALGSCTSMTIRLYARQKNWPLKRVRVSVTHHRPDLHARDLFEKEITIEGTLDDAQKARLIAVAERCPVHLTLTRGADVTTKLTDTKVSDEPKDLCEHMTNMVEACK
jgi:putative redox protein